MVQVGIPLSATQVIQCKTENMYIGIHKLLGSIVKRHLVSSFAPTLFRFTS